jgi:hypothetical protein
VGGYLARLAVVVGVLAGVVLGNGVHCVGGMTAMVIERAASSCMPAGIAQSVATAGAQRPVPRAWTRRLIARNRR